MDDTNYRKYKDLRAEDFIWFIYFFILFGNLYSNHLQEDNYTGKKYTSSKKISKINITILVTLLIIYIYFFYKSYQNLQSSYLSKDERAIELNKLLVFASILFIISGALFLFVEANSIGEDEIGLF